MISAIWIGLILGSVVIAPTGTADQTVQVGMVIAAVVLLALDLARRVRDGRL